MDGRAMAVISISFLLVLGMGIVSPVKACCRNFMWINSTGIINITDMFGEVESAFGTINHSQVIINTRSFTKGSMIEVSPVPLSYYEYVLNDSSGGSNWSSYVLCMFSEKLPNETLVVTVNGNDFSVQLPDGYTLCSTTLSNFWNESNGKDIRFVNSTSELHYYLAEFNSTEQIFSAYISVPSGTKVLCMFYGNKNASTSKYLLSSIGQTIPWSDVVSISISDLVKINKVETNTSVIVNTSYTSQEYGVPINAWINMSSGYLPSHPVMLENFLGHLYVNGTEMDPHTYSVKWVVIVGSPSGPVLSTTHYSLSTPFALPYPRNDYTIFNRPFFTTGSGISIEMTPYLVAQEEKDVYTQVVVNYPYPTFTLTVYSGTYTILIPGSKVIIPKTFFRVNWAPIAVSGTVYTPSTVNISMEFNDHEIFNGTIIPFEIRKLAINESMKQGENVMVINSTLPIFVKMKTIMWVYQMISRGFTYHPPMSKAIFEFMHDIPAPDGWKTLNDGLEISGCTMKVKSVVPCTVKIYDFSPYVVKYERDKNKVEVANLSITTDYHHVNITVVLTNMTPNTTFEIIRNGKKWKEVKSNATGVVNFTDNEFCTNYYVLDAVLSAGTSTTTSTSTGTSNTPIGAPPPPPPPIPVPKYTITGVAVIAVGATGVIFAALLARRRLKGKR